MTGEDLFAVIFLATITIGLPLCAFLEYGGDEIIADKIVKFIESRIKKTEDI